MLLHAAAGSDQSAGRVKSKNFGGSCRPRACKIACWPGVVAERCLAVGGGEGDQVHAVEFVAEVAPGVAGGVVGVVGDADQQQRQPAQLDVGADAVFAVVEPMSFHPRSTAISCL